MKYTCLYLFIATVFIPVALKAQNPFSEYGVKAEVLSLTNGKYSEYFDEDTIVQIGTVLFNTNINRIVAFVQQDTAYTESALKPEITSRWLSPDPLAAEFPYSSPYVYASNNPILFIDEGGMKTSYYMFDQDKNTYTLVFSSNDNLPNGITIINPESNYQFTALMDEADATKKDINDKYFNTTLRQNGVTYLTDDLQRLNEYGTTQEKSGYYNPDTEKEVALKNEYSNYLVTTDASGKTVTIGPQQQDKEGNPTTSEWGTPPANAVGQAHSHTEAGTEVLVKNSAGMMAKIEFTGKPSSDDYSNHKNAKKGYYNVVVSPEGISFYNYKTKDPNNGNADPYRPTLIVPKEEVPK